MVTTTVPNAGKPSHRNSADVQAIWSTGCSVMPVHSGIMTAVSQMVCRALTRRLFVCAAHRVYNCMHDIDKLICLFQDFRVILLTFILILVYYTPVFFIASLLLDSKC